MSSRPEWARNPPTVFDIVTGFYPETSPKGEGANLRPCLVLKVLRHKTTGDFHCKIAYGTSNLRLAHRHDRDIVIQNTSDLDQMGLAMATRFALDEDQTIIMPWSPPHFDTWPHCRTPRIGTLLLEYQKHYAWIMMRRLGS